MHLAGDKAFWRKLTQNLYILAIFSLSMGASAEGNTAVNIGTSWPDRRPIGRIIFAAPTHITPANINGWENGGPKVIGAVAFRQDILARVSTSIANVKKMRGQGIIIWDITGCGKTSWKLPHEQYLGDPRFLDPKGSGLTVKTAYGPYVPPGSALGIRGIEQSMNSIANKIFASIRSAGLACGVAIRAEKVSVNSEGQLDGSVNDGELIYDTVTHQLADLDAKLVYAYNRWGCRIFYVDSNAASQELISAQQMQCNPTWAPAWLYTELHRRHPDCVIFPEEIYTGSFKFSSAGINDPAYQYERAASRYTELRNQWQSPFVGSNETAAVPDTFTLICASNIGSSDPADTPKIIAALQAHRCILMADVWHNDPGITLIKIWQTDAGVNGF
ncbi:MAG: hypothetical protein JO333_15765 [Verrucomicrobia bacterium]|nr:hypothetical protein [Verrucomicrobiota bacterium]